MATFWEDQLITTKALLAAYQAASLALATMGAQEMYKLDTGQSIITVKRSDLDMIQNQIDNLLNQCVTIETRITGTGSHTSVPGW